MVTVVYTPFVFSRKIAMPSRRMFTLHWPLLWDMTFAPVLVVLHSLLCHFSLSACARQGVAKHANKHNNRLVCFMIFHPFILSFGPFWDGPVKMFSTDNSVQDFRKRLHFPIK